MYECPISLYQETQEKILNGLTNELERQIICEIQTKYSIDVDKEELLKALQYDREQYDKGFQDGKAERPVAVPVKFFNDPYTGKRFTTCSRCDGKISPKDNYCKHCGAEMVEVVGNVYDDPELLSKDDK